MKLIGTSSFAMRGFILFNASFLSVFHLNSTQTYQLQSFTFTLSFRTDSLYLLKWCSHNASIASFGQKAWAHGPKKQVASITCNCLGGWQLARRRYYVAKSMLQPRHATVHVADCRKSASCVLPQCNKHNTYVLPYHKYMTFQCNYLNFYCAHIFTFFLLLPKSSK